MSKNENQNHTLQKQLAIALKSGAISITPPIKTSYQEKSLSPEEHLELMVSRGLIVDDKAKALHYIRFIGYFRLSGYSKFFRQDGTSEFKSGITFSDIFELYKFDRKLRILVMDVHKRIEIAIRVVISNHMSHKYDPHWFM